VESAIDILQNGEKMADKSNVDFKKYTGVDILTAVRILMKKGITTGEIEDLTTKLYKGIGENVVDRNLDDEYKVLLNMVLAYYLFSSGIKAYNEWIKKEAAEHNMKPEKYIKIMFSL